MSKANRESLHRYQIRLDPNEPNRMSKRWWTRTRLDFRREKQTRTSNVGTAPIFKPEGSQTYDPSSWRERLLRPEPQMLTIRRRIARGRETDLGFVAACLRSVTNCRRCLTKNETGAPKRMHRSGCGQSDGWDYRERKMQRFEMSADRLVCIGSATTFGPRSLASQYQPITEFSQVFFVAALTHPVDECDGTPTWGFANHLWVH